MSDRPFDINNTIEFNIGGKVVRKTYREYFDDMIPQAQRYDALFGLFAIGRQLVYAGRTVTLVQKLVIKNVLPTSHAPMLKFSYVSNSGCIEYISVGEEQRSYLHAMLREDTRLRAQGCVPGPPYKS